MKKKFSRSWNKSKQPRKQRKYVANAPNHIKTRFLRAHLEKTIKEKYKKRSARIRKGDEVLIMRGEFRKKKGKVKSFDIRKSFVYIEGIKRKKSNGQESDVGIKSSNLMITVMETKDKIREKILNRGNENEKIRDA